MVQKVYISSTNDLEAHRGNMKWAITQLNMTPIMWEDYGLTGDQINPLTLMHNEIDKSDIFVGIYARRYGGKPQVDIEGNEYKDEKSYTEIEYDWAVAKGLPCLLFFISTDASDTNLPQKHLEAAQKEREQGRSQLLEAFRKKALSQFRVEFFTDEHDLLVAALIRLARLKIPSADSTIVKPIFGEAPQGDQYKCDVFMVMPFANEFNSIYVDYIKPTVQAMGLLIKRGDDFYTAGGIMTDIWAAINACCFIIADCTGRNPNVFYEIGIAHTLGKPTILITQNINDVPFDLRHLRIIVYEDKSGPLKKLQENLKMAIDRLLPETECREKNSISKRLPRYASTNNFYVRSSEEE